MKVRMKGNSLRLRIPRSELDRLARDGRIEETIWFASVENGCQTWALEHSADVRSATVRFAPPEIAIVFPSGEVERWARGDEVGIYATLDLGARGSLDLIVEKDFTCLHGSAEENRDAFPNPHAVA
jgi:hypothetical protein